MDRRSHRPWGLLALVAAAFTVAGCCGSGGTSHRSCGDPGALPPFPVDADPCAAYCLVWVPPVYRDVPTYCPKPGCEVTERVPMEKVVFEEVCKPGCYTPHQTPDRCRRNAIVQVGPSREEWVQVSCPGGACCDPGRGDCWKRIVHPPEYKVCETCETEKGISYCTYCPPEREVVAKTVRCDIERTRYIPADLEIVWKKECMVPGHYEWQVRYDCTDAALPAPKRTCVPMCGK